MVLSPKTTSLDVLVREIEVEAAEQAKNGGVVLTTSFSKEDQILTWAVVQSGAEVEVVSLDTGYLFPATRKTWEETQVHFGMEIRSLNPDREDVESLEGLDRIYQSVEARKECCGIRKIRPLRAALAGKGAWLTGLRRAHSPNRASMERREQDAAWGILKVHPLLDWDDGALDSAVAATGVPVNPLHAMGYPSIGCAPCTRPVLPHEDARAGRWWWEQSAKECGLHRG
jgi:phosphoadenosine phosphosulfate reductase